MTPQHKPARLAELAAVLQRIGLGPLEAEARILGIPLDTRALELFVFLRERGSPTRAELRERFGAMSVSVAARMLNSYLDRAGDLRRASLVSGPKDGWRWALIDRSAYVAV